MVRLTCSLFATMPLDADRATVVPATATALQIISYHDQDTLLHSNVQSEPQLIASSSYLNILRSTPLSKQHQGQLHFFLYLSTMCRAFLAVSSTMLSLLRYQDKSRGGKRRRTNTSCSKVQESSSFVLCLCRTFLAVFLKVIGSLCSSERIKTCLEGVRAMAGECLKCFKSSFSFNIYYHSATSNLKHRSSPESQVISTFYGRCHKQSNIKFNCISQVISTFDGRRH